ncbi:MAG: carbohydrate kinase family protein [Candidatus Doudnabacteria bacterium]|nr:carbohydrate kinase family protein [Candidatus Doudnabacteria bacterium]
MFDVMCLPSLNLEFRLKSDAVIPEGMRGKKLTAESLEFGSEKVTASVQGQRFSFEVSGLVPTLAGSSVNCAVGFSRLGLKTVLAGAVRGDVESLETVATLFVERGAVMATTLCVVDSTGAATLFCKKPPYTLSDLLLKQLSSVSCPMVVATGVRQAEIAVVTELFQKRLTRAHCNMLTPNAEVIGSSGLNQLLRFTDVLQINEVEAEMLVGRTEDPGRAALSLLKLGPKVVLLTLGNQGAAVAVFSEDGNHTVFWQEALKAQVVDTTGAGDAFTVGFVSALHMGLGHGECLKVAAWTAAENISAFGGHGGMPYKERLSEYLAGQNIGNLKAA